MPRKDRHQHLNGIMAAFRDAGLEPQSFGRSDTRVFFVTAWHPTEPKRLSVEERNDGTFVVAVDELVAPPGGRGQAPMKPLGYTPFRSYEAARAFAYDIAMIAKHGRKKAMRARHGRGEARENPAASRSETAANLLVACIARHGTLRARVWIPKSGLPRVYIGNAGYVTISGYDVSAESRGTMTLIESSLYPAQRATWKAGLASYRKAAEAATAEESAPALAQDEPTMSRNDQIDATVLSAYKTLGYYNRQKIASVTGLDLFTLALAERRLGLPIPNPTEHDARLDLERHVGGMSSLLAASRLVKSPALAAVEGGGIHFWWPKAWAVTVDAADDASAAKIGAKIRKGLVAKKSLSASDPYLHDLPLYAIHRGGWVLVEKDATAKAPAKATSVSDEKRALQDKAQAYFGANGATLRGAEGRYTLQIKPALAKHRGVFSEGSISASTLPALEEKLDAAIAKLDAFIASR